MNILFFVGSLNAGGAERVATTLANAWVRRGDTVTLVITHLGSKKSFYPLDDRVDAVWLGRRLTRVQRQMPALGKLLAMRRLVKDVEPDVVLSFLTNVNVNVLLSTCGLRVPTVVCERSNPAFSTSANRALRLLRRGLYRHASSVALQTHDSVPAFRAMVPGLRHVAVVPNPIPPDLADSCRQDRSGGDLSRDDSSPDGLEPATVGQAGGPVAVSQAREAVAASQTPAPATAGQPGGHIVAMGRLMPVKQFDRLISAFARLASEFPDWHLVIHGEGPQRDALTRQVGQLGLRDRIALPGTTPAPWDALRQAHIFALTSRTEGFPNVLLEAMALGLPCVATDCPSGPAEITAGGRDALLVPAADENALVDALRRLMRDGDLRHRLGRQAAHSVRERYGLPAILAQWDAVFRDALDAGSRP